jgi:hypothetical protein
VPTDAGELLAIDHFVRGMVASYKFALGNSLLALARQGREVVTLEQLAAPFSRNLCEHLRTADKQATSRSSRLLDCCRKYNAGETKLEELVDTTSKLGFANVIDEFHIVHDKEVGVRFLPMSAGATKREFVRRRTCSSSPTAFCRRIYRLRLKLVGGLSKRPGNSVCRVTC